MNSVCYATGKNSITTMRPKLRPTRTCIKPVVLYPNKNKPLTESKSECRFVVSQSVPKLTRIFQTSAELPTRTALQPLFNEGLKSIGAGLLGTAAAAALLLTPLSTAQARSLSFPVATSPGVFEVQKTIAEAWAIVAEAYVDPSFNGTDWEAELGEELTAASASSNPNEARQNIVSMLSKLGDPFTRWIPPKEYNDFRVSSDGEIQGVGLLIASDPASGKLMVLAPIKGGPAEKAGIQPGDEVLAVDGQDTQGWDSDLAAAHLRGKRGSSVLVEVGRRREDMLVGAGRVEIPGRAGLQLLEPELERKRYRIRRDLLELSPVFATTVRDAEDQHTFGYLRLVTFSQHAAEDMRKAVNQLRKDGAEGFILDLRNNPGGLVKSALEVAGVWLDPRSQPTIFSVLDRRGGDAIEEVKLDGDIPAISTAPLVVLVNHNSASASEILAGALRDNHRAEVVGEATFGKGKIQSVFELGDGSALFVTVAKYKTPAGEEIDKIGVKPNRGCSLGQPGGGQVTIPGIPVGPGADDLVLQELSNDDCVLTAENVLEEESDSMWKLMAKAPPLKAKYKA